MASNSGKFRFVRCPKCLQLLIEYSTVPLYQCGGCGTVLKAKNKNPDGESPGLNLDETQNHLNSSSENVSPDSLSVFSTEPNNTPSSSNTHPSEPSEDEFKANPFTKSSPTKQSLASNVHPSEQSEDEYKATPATNNLPPEETRDPHENPNEQAPNVEDERDEMQTAHSVLSEEDMMSRCSNAYDGSISSSDEGKINIHDRSYYLQKSRRTFRKKAPAGDKRKEKEGLPPRPPSEKFGMRYQGDEVQQGVSLDSSDFQIIQSLIESNAPYPSLIDKYKKSDHRDSLRKMDELRDKLNVFSKQREGNILYHQEGIDSTQRLHYQNAEGQESPLCFDLRHSRNQLRSQYPYNMPPPSQPSHCACLHCTTGLYRSSSRNLSASSSFPGSPISIDRESSTRSSSRDKRILTRKHICRPIFGGTPYVICENCFSLLQVPSTILIAKKRLVELECGKCSEVLTVPLPSKKFSDKRVVPDHFHGTGMVGDASFARSYSIGAESAYNGDEGDREAALSSLHRLMGYNSATELLYSRADRGYDSFESMVPHSRTRRHT